MGFGRKLAQLLLDEELEVKKVVLTIKGSEPLQAEWVGETVNLESKQRPLPFEVKGPVN